MAQQNEKQPKAKTGLARCLELASGHKGLVFLAGFLAALAAICSFVPYLSIYYIIREILFVYPDMSLLNVSTISTWGWLALAGILGNIVFYFFALLCSHVAAFGTLYELKVAFADHIMQIPLGYHLTLGSGKMRKIMDENIESVEKFIAHQLPDFVASLVAPLVLVIILLGIDWRYGVVCLVGIVLAFIMQNMCAVCRRSKHLIRPPIPLSGWANPLQTIPLLCWSTHWAGRTVCLLLPRSSTIFICF